ncbi:MAG: CvpA family protein [Deltaproteobacteria bacterium]|nr:MAG: CvpA family protein [Deltaproteobacteria bacterium]
MNILDFVLLTIMAVAMVRGLMRGMIRQIASLLGILTGFVVAGHLYIRFLPLLRRQLPSVPYLEVLSYLAVFATTWLAILLMGLLAAKVSRASLMGGADRLLGGAFGLLKGATAAVVLVAILTLFLPGKSQIIKGSLLSFHAQRAGYVLVRLTPKELRHQYKERQEDLLRYLRQQQTTR